MMISFPATSKIHQQLSEFRHGLEAEFTAITAAICDHVQRAAHRAADQKFMRADKHVLDFDLEAQLA